MATRWRIAILLAVITTINYIDRSVFGVVAPVVRDQFGIGDADYGLITSGFLLAYGIGQLISGPLIDRLGTKRAFSLAAVFWSVATILHALGRGAVERSSPSEWYWALRRRPTFRRRARRSPNGFRRTSAPRQWLFSCWARDSGAIITPPLTVWTMQTLGWQWAFIVPGSLGLIWVFLWPRGTTCLRHILLLSPGEKALILEQRSNQQSQGSWMVLAEGYREFWGILSCPGGERFSVLFFPVSGCRSI